MEYVEIAPTWRAAVEIYIHGLEFGEGEDGKQAARAELRRLADIVDRASEGRE